MFQKTIVTCLLILFFGESNAQFSTNIVLPNQGILPFSGAKFFCHGMSGEEIKILLAEDTWTSNKLPIETEFEIKLVKPSGLNMASDGNYYPGIEVLILDSKKDTLGFAENIFGNESQGLDASMLKSLTLSLGFNEQTKPGDTVQILAKFFDTRSSNFLLVDFPVIIVEPDLPLNTTNTTFSVKKSDSYYGKSTGVELSEANVILTDHSKSTLLEISFPALTEITEQEFENGKSTVWTIDDDLNENIFPKPAIKVETKPENLSLNISLPMTPESKQVRFRWESSDGKKVLDFVCQI